MARGHWLVKSEPDTYSWDALVRDRSTRWDGVRNPQARNHLEAMGKGDLVLFYHSGGAREVVGVARVTRAHYPDPTGDGERWLAVDLAPLRPLREPVSLARIKAEPALREIPLVRPARLSVMPLARDAFERILRMGRTPLPRRAA